MSYPGANTMGFANKTRTATQQMEDWHDSERHMFALDMCDHPACRAFTSVAGFEAPRYGFATNIKAAVNNFIGRGSTREREKNTELYMTNRRAKPAKKKGNKS